MFEASARMRRGWPAAAVGLSPRSRRRWPLLAAGCRVPGTSSGQAAAGPADHGGGRARLRGRPAAAGGQGRAVRPARRAGNGARPTPACSGPTRALASGQAEVVSGDYAEPAVHAGARAPGAAAADRGRVRRDAWPDGGAHPARLGRHRPAGPGGQDGGHPAAGTRPLLGGRPVQHRDAGHRGGAAERRCEPVQRGVEGHAAGQHDQRAARSRGQRDRGHRSPTSCRPKPSSAPSSCSTCAAG